MRVRPPGRPANRRSMIPGRVRATKTASRYLPGTMTRRRGRTSAARTARATMSGPGIAPGRFAVSGVAMYPGSINVTPIPVPANSRRTESVMPRSPNFVAEYGPWTPISPASEPMLTIAPRPRSRMIGITARIKRMGASRLIAIICSSRASSVMASSVMIEWACPIPAMLTRPSMRPFTASAVATSRSRSSGRVTSVGTVRAAPPRRAI